MKNKFFFATIVLLLYIEVSPAKAQALFDIETGTFFTGYNDVRIPGDKETNTQKDINQGIVNIFVGFAPLKPAEFVLIKIQQLAGQIET